jgi:hypothetical protein
MSDNFETLENFISRNGILMDCERVDSNPAMDDSRDMDHWRCTLTRPGRRLTVIFSMGPGHHGKAPDSDEVLNCLSLDAGGVENARDFEDWCANYGYDTDSRKAYRIYKACMGIAKKLRRFLGDAEFDKLNSHEVECL